MGKQQEPQALDEMQRELLTVQLETARVTLEKAKRDNEKFHVDTRTAEQKRASAQKSIAGEKRLATNLKNACRHKQGGIGLEGTLKGKGEPSLLIMQLPVAGYEYIQCYRCLGEWITPDPALKKADAAKYKEHLAEFRRIKELALESSSTPLGAPTFSFTNQDDVPVIPSLV